MQAQRLYPGFPAPSGISSGRYSPSQYARTGRCVTNSSANLFGPIDESLFQARAEAALAASMDVKVPPTMSMSCAPSSMFRPGDMLSPYHPAASAHLPTTSHPNSMEFPTFHDPSTIPSSISSVEQHMSPVSVMHPAAPFPQYVNPGIPSIGMPNSFVPSSLPPGSAPSRYCPPGIPVSAATGEPDTDPRELERFAEYFKQRRIKLGVTQADVGKALAHLKMPGVGSLSQSTICRFESLTLSHNNMVALKPILQSWLEKAEDAAKGKTEAGILPNAEKKRKRTSIAAPEKRSLEAYFSLQPRPSGDKIAAIAEKLDLKKNVVRVWFCNQRQKQKRSTMEQVRGFDWSASPPLAVAEVGGRAIARPRTSSPPSKVAIKASHLRKRRPNRE